MSKFLAKVLTENQKKPRSIRDQFIYEITNLLDDKRWKEITNYDAKVIFDRAIYVVRGE